MSTSTIPVHLKVLKMLTTAWSWLFLLFIIGFFEIWSWSVYGRTFFGNLYNVQSVLLTATQILMMALGLTFIIISAGIDLSIGFIAGLAAVTMAVVIRAMPDVHPALSFTLGVTAGISIALIPGMINGWLVARLKVPSFIGTLGMFGVTRGAAFLIAGGATVSIRNSVARDFGNGKIFDIVPIPVAVAIVITYRTLLGRRCGCGRTDTVKCSGRSLYRRCQFNRWQWHYCRHRNWFTHYCHHSIWSGIYWHATFLAIHHCGACYYHCSTHRPIAR